MLRLKNILTIAMLFLFITSTVFSFDYVVKVLTKGEIKQLKNEELIDLYKKVTIERHAQENFFGKAGYSAKDYQNYKDLLEFIVNIREEMSKREIEPPPVSDWLR